MNVELETTSDRTQAFILTGQLIVAATADTPMTDLAVDEFVAKLVPLVEGRRVAGLLQYSPSQSPTAAQRQRLANATAGKHPLKRVALVSESRLVRGAITALSWLIPGTQTRAFAPRGCRAAFDWLAQEVAFDVRVA